MGSRPPRLASAAAPHYQWSSAPHPNIPEALHCSLWRAADDVLSLLAAARSLPRPTQAGRVRCTNVQHTTAAPAAYLDAAGGIAGNAAPLATPPPPPRSSQPFSISRESARDVAANTIIPKQFEPGTGDAARDDLLHKFWVRLVEMTAAETVATVIYEQQGMPWPFYHDLARHCWDETRHALFGQAAIESEGLDFRAMPQWVGYALHQMALEPMERYAHLATGEARYMRYPPGARFDFEWMRDVGKHALFARYLDFDWADEVLHAQFGRRWIVQHQLGGDVKLAHQIKDMTDERRRDFYLPWARDHPDLLPVAEAERVAAKSKAT